jgi:murein DD-endopeptidase MepM/ murein hydrolase activator NlpD
MKIVKLIVTSLLILGVAWIGRKGYLYFFDKTRVEASLSGIEHQGCYAGDVSCILSGEHPHKVKTISLFLDGKPLIYNYVVGKSSFEYPFTLQTTPLNNGKHTLRVKVIASSFYKNEKEWEVPFVVDNVPLQAAFVKPNTENRVFQGKTLHIQFQTNKPLASATAKIFARSFHCYPEATDSLIYETFIPIETEEKPNEYMLYIECVDQTKNTLMLETKLQVIPYPFKKVTLHVDPKKMEEERAMSEDNDGLAEQLEKVTAASPHKKLWNGSFCLPTEVSQVFTEFGTLRVTQAKGMYAHKGVDIGKLPKGVVWAPQDGMVVIKDRYTYSGNTVVIDHGWGLLSLYFHLDSMPENLTVGKMVKKGNPIGTVGKTGYANGYHLHWEIRINNTPVDALEWTKPGF